MFLEPCSKPVTFLSAGFSPRASDPEEEEPDRLPMDSSLPCEQRSLYPPETQGQDDVCGTSRSGQGDDGVGCSSPLLQSTPATTDTSRSRTYTGSILDACPSEQGWLGPSLSHLRLREVRQRQLLCQPSCRRRYAAVAASALMSIGVRQII